MTDLYLRTYRTGGAGLPLVLLHGFPFDSRMWDAAAAEVDGDRAVLAVDLPGLGRSTGPVPATASIDASADAVARTLAADGVTEAVVAGLSMGGYVALAMAERHSGLVAGLGLLDTRATADDPAARQNRLRIAAQVEEAASTAPVRDMATSLLGETTRTVRPHLVDLLAGWIEDQDPAGVAWSERAMAGRPDRSEVLHRCPAPVLVVVGDEDRLAPVAIAQDMASRALDSRLVVVPRTGHMTAVEDPAAVGLALAELAQQADTRR